MGFRAPLPRSHGALFFTGSGAKLVTYIAEFLAGSSICLIALFFQIVQQGDFPSRLCSRANCFWSSSFLTVALSNCMVSCTSVRQLKRQHDVNLLHGR